MTRDEPFGVGESALSNSVKAPQGACEVTPRGPALPPKSRTLELPKLRSSALAAGLRWGRQSERRTEPPPGLTGRLKTHPLVGSHLTCRRLTYLAAACRWSHSSGGGAP